ncbi:MAG: His-Xaa-Ser system radical SAM maturase HxsB [Candidatus Omnitrophica bacterium]|nr:His-Xaa-Ser system radical SAM maturase HxsB [Candidatus Omnitrophota bacterium]
MPEELQQKDWALLPYNIERINGEYLLSNYFGSWDILTKKEFKEIEQFNLKEDGPLFKRLYKKGLILGEKNLKELIDNYRELNSHLFTDAGLHIVVVTTRCNLNCLYCQAKADKPKDMNTEVAAKVLDCLLTVRNPNVNLEFQGGEPFLNWDTVKFLIENARKVNIPSSKSLAISMVTNGTLWDREKINYLINHNVSICISLDGPKEIHNKNRVFKDGKGSYQKVREAIEDLKEIYRERGLENERPIDLLPTITRYSLQFPKEIIDEYVSFGARKIAIRPVSQIGIAQKHWEKIGYSPEEFNLFWAKALDYILELNRKGVEISERMAYVFLKKILKKQNPGYVDLMSPCGAGRQVLAYMSDGDVYPCDEARMAGSDIFKLGNVLNDKYEDLMKSPNLFPVCQASLVDLWDYNNAYLPWIGVCPVVNYILTGNLVPRIHANPMYKIYRFQIEYLFKKMMEDKKNEEIFNEWVK